MQAKDLPGSPPVSRVATRRGGGAGCRDHKPATRNAAPSLSGPDLVCGRHWYCLYIVGSLDDVGERHVAAAASRFVFWCELHQTLA